MRRIIISIVMLLFPLLCIGQISVESITDNVMDLTASVQKRLDLNGKPCALVKIEMISPQATFQGNVVGEVSYNVGEYLVYVSSGTKLLRISHPDQIPLTIRFDEFGINQLLSEHTYVVKVILPSSSEHILSNGFQYVDLGLSVLWATCNVGASRPELYGDYFAWGEVCPKAEYLWENYKFFISGRYYDDNLILSKYNIIESHGDVDNLTCLSLTDDAANAIMGGRWRIPTLEETKELEEKCTWKWSDLNGVQGVWVTSKINGNSIFLPGAGYQYSDGPNHNGFGYYWTSSLYQENTGCAHVFSFFQDNKVFSLTYAQRAISRTIRPVLDNDIPVSGIYLSTTSQIIEVAQKLQLTATLLPTQTDQTKIIWKSDDNNIVSVLQDGTIVGVNAGTTHVWAISSEGRYASKCLIKVEPSLSGFCEGHEWVDLGLASGTKWATCNIGATHANEAGLYFAWGEIESKQDYNWSTYKWCNGERNSLLKYNSTVENGRVDNLSILDSTDDPACVIWGMKWRTPSVEDMIELCKSCTWTWCEESGVSGYKVTSKLNNKSIFIPDAGDRYESYIRGGGGCYWTRTTDSKDATCAYCLNFGKIGVYPNTAMFKMFGMNIRPVIK